MGNKLNANMIRKLQFYSKLSHCFRHFGIPFFSKSSSQIQSFGDIKFFNDSIKFGDWIKQTYHKKQQQQESNSTNKSKKTFSKNIEYQKTQWDAIFAQIKDISSNTTGNIPARMEITVPIDHFEEFLNLIEENSISLSKSLTNQLRNHHQQQQSIIDFPFIFVKSCELSKFLYQMFIELQELEVMFTKLSTQINEVSTRFPIPPTGRMFFHIQLAILEDLLRYLITGSRFNTPFYSEMEFFVLEPSWLCGCLFWAIKGPTLQQLIHKSIDFHFAKGGGMIDIQYLADLLDSKTRISLSKTSSDEIDIDDDDDDMSLQRPGDIIDKIQKLQKSSSSSNNNNNSEEQQQSDTTTTTSVGKRRYGRKAQKQTILEKIFSFGKSTTITTSSLQNSRFSTTTTTINSVCQNPNNVVETTSSESELTTPPPKFVNNNNYYIRNVSILPTSIESFNSHIHTATIPTQPSYQLQLNNSTTTTTLGNTFQVYYFSLVFCAWRAFARQIRSLAPQMDSFYRTLILILFFFDECASWCVKDEDRIVDLLRDIVTHLDIEMVAVVVQKEEQEEEEEINDDIDIDDDDVETPSLLRRSPRFVGKRHRRDQSTTTTAATMETDKNHLKNKSTKAKATIGKKNQKIITSSSSSSSRQTGQFSARQQQQQQQQRAANEQQVDEIREFDSIRQLATELVKIATQMPNVFSGKVARMCFCF